ncbi:hypothetical protein QOZ80_7AG0552280 [Eleusine coracana subsp. coracana]|nr:hypothetical protein QOZ80_7AG0552280 [Eleusine coracana subsp. coracana]
MKTKAAAAHKATVDEDEGDPKKIRSSRSKRRHTRRSSVESESPPLKRSKKSSKRTADKKSKRSKVSSSRRRRHSPSPSLSVSSSSPSSVSRSYSTCSSSSDRSVSPPPRSRSGDVKKRKDRGRDRDRDPKRRKARRSASSSGTSSSGSRQTRSKSSKRSTKDGTTRHKIEKDYDNRHVSLSEKNTTNCFDRDEEAIVVAKKGRDYETVSYEKNVSLEAIKYPPYNNANETEDILPASGGSPVAEDLELILRQKALENFRKFREAASISGKTDKGATGKEMPTDSPQNAGTKVAEARSAAGPFQRQASNLGVRHPTGSPRSVGKQENSPHGTNHAWNQESSAGMSRGAGSPRIREDGDTAGPTQQEGRKIEASHSSPQPRSAQHDRNSRSVMQRLVSTPGGAASVNQRLGSSAGVSHVNGAPRIKSVVSIPAREGLDGCTTPQRPCEISAPVESSCEIRHTPIDINKAEGINGDDRKRTEASASASDGSILSSADGKRQVTEARIEDKDGSQFQKKTFSRMHDGETVEVSYKVYIPKKTPALARRKLQR